VTQPISMDRVEFIEVDALKIRFRRNRVGGGIPVVLTSPWPESLYAYQRIWPILGAEASLIAFDIPGFGQSESWPQLMSPRAMGDFIPEILAALGLDRVHAIGPDVGTSALLFAANANSNLFESLVVGSGAIDAALTAGMLKDIINAPSTASFEERSGEMFATGAIDLMMKTKPDSQALKDYQASSAGRRYIGVAKRDRSNKRGERELGVDTGWKVFLANQHAPEFATKTEGGADVFYERRLIIPP
jgi:pimeloyl-ACP methyl ester carboxylesterase